MSKDDTVYLKHILDSINQIEIFIENLDYEKFMKSRLIYDAVIREFEVIGEATKNLSKDLKSKYHDLPWKNISGMRDKLIHGYMGVDLKEVWKTTGEDIPNLKRHIIQILNDIEMKD